MPDKANVTLPGQVEKVINSPDPSVPEKAEIKVNGADELYQEIRIPNNLSDEKGKKVKLKRGDPVDITVETVK